LRKPAAYEKWTLTDYRPLTLKRDAFQRVGQPMSAFGRYCCKKIFGIRASNIESKSGIQEHN
jgi:hypothetical protein